MLNFCLRYGVKCTFISVCFASTLLSDPEPPAPACCGLNALMLPLPCGSQLKSGRVQMPCVGPEWVQ